MRKKRNWIRHVGILSMAVVCIGMFEPARNFVSATAGYGEQISDAKDKKKELEEKKKALKNKLQTLEGEKDDILSYIKDLDEELGSLTADITTLNEEIEEVSQKLDQTKKELKQAEKTEKTQYETMKARIQYMYENGETSLIEVLLNSENIADLLNQVEYVEQITGYDNLLLDRYTKTKEKVSNVKKKLENTLKTKYLTL